MKTFFIAVIFLAGASAARAETKLSDGEITTVLLTINDGEIDAAKMAQSKSKNDDIKSFASMMAAQHKENALASQKVATDNKLDTKESALSKSLKAEAKSENGKLAKAGGAFDKSYLAEQVKMHEKALNTIDTVLLPNATNGDLHTHLVNTRTAVAEHLDHAKMLQQKFQ